MPFRRTTLTADADDLVLLNWEAHRRGLSLGAYLGEVVGREADTIRASRRPRVGVVDRPTAIAQSMQDEPNGPAATEYRLE